MAGPGGTKPGGGGRSWRGPEWPLPTGVAPAGRGVGAPFPLRISARPERSERRSRSGAAIVTGRVRGGKPSTMAWLPPWSALSAGGFRGPPLCGNDAPPSVYTVGQPPQPGSARTWTDPASSAQPTTQAEATNSHEPARRRTASSRLFPSQRRGRRRSATRERAKRQESRDDAADRDWRRAGSAQNCDWRAHGIASRVRTIHGGTLFPRRRTPPNEPAKPIMPASSLPCESPPRREPENVRPVRP